MTKDQKAVYALVDPQRPDAAYVGITNNPNRRYSQHLRDIQDPENCSKKADFFRITLERGGEIVMQIISIFDDEHEAVALENSLIQQIGTLNKKRSSYRLSYRRA